MGSTSRAIIRGAAAGLAAGIPQVLVAQVTAKILRLPAAKADIGPRLVERLANNQGMSLHPVSRWGLAAVFHFGYSAWWGGLYGLTDRWLRPPPALAGSALGGVIYLAAFSRWGGGTQSGTEPQPDRRGRRIYLLQWTAALTFSLTTAFTYRWLRDVPGYGEAAVAAPASPLKSSAPSSGAPEPPRIGERTAW